MSEWDGHLRNIDVGASSEQGCELVHPASKEPSALRWFEVSESL